MFTADDIQARVQRRPFVPVRIVTSAGQSYDIPHPDLAMVGDREVMVGTASSQSPRRYSQTTRLPIIHITALEDLPTPVSTSTNGET